MPVSKLPADIPSKDLLSLLHSLPCPIAVFTAADGGLVTANALFCKVMELPEAERARIVGDGSGVPTDEQLLFRLHIVNENLAHFISPSGFRALVDADVRTLRLGETACRMIVPAAETWQAPQRHHGITGHYRSLLENLNEVIYVNDRNAEVVYVSPNIHRLAGYEAHEVIGRSFTEFVHPEDLEGRIEIFLKILGGEDQATEYRMITKTGEIKWARTNARPIIRDGEVVGMQGALVDVTDRKTVEAALRHSEEKYRNVVQNAKDAIFVTQDQRLQFMNPSASAILGYTCEAIADRPFAAFIHPEDREMIMDRYNRRLAGEDIPDSVAFRIVNRRGDIREVELKAMLIEWEGRPAVLNFLRDITVQNKMERRLRNTQKMEALGTLSGGVAHNFNNLLMGINGYACLSLARMNPSNLEYSHLAKIVELVKSGSKLTRQLLQYARTGTVAMEPVDLNQLVKDAAETLTATKRQIQVKFRLSAEAACIRGDQGQIEQVLLNLLLNAADAMPGGGDVFIETARPKGVQAGGQMALASHEDSIVLKVSDRGAGMPKAVLDRIFEPFFTTKGLGRGTGLGLSTTYGIVKNHGGDIWVESEVGTGSTFFVYLPAATKDARQPPATDESCCIPCHGTILLIDDEPHVLHASTSLLEHLGFTVLTADRGAKARELFQENWQKIDLVLLDLILPDVNGADLYHVFREIDPRVKVMICSGYGPDGQAVELITSGCLGVIQKPYNITELSKTMMEIITAGKGGSLPSPMK
jgi:two-component system cell cycle sensor histidine kinase/response regulator CckA